MTRTPAVAGTFYPNSQNTLTKLIEDYLASVKDNLFPGTLKAVIAPHAGYIYSGPAAAYAYKLVTEQSPLPQKIILIGPSHHITIRKYASSGKTEWLTPLGKVPLFQPLPDIPINDQAHTPEHSLEVQIPFLQTILPDFQLFPIIINDPQYSPELADLIEPLLDDKTLIVASSDLSHFYSLEDAQKLDSIANEYIPKLDTTTVIQQVEACGLAAIITVMLLAKKLEWHGKTMTYQTSANASGDTSRVVGYGTYAFKT